MNNPFLSSLQHRLKLDERNSWKNNWDFRRYGSSKTQLLLARFKLFAKSTLKLLGLYKNPQYQLILTHASSFQWLYESLKDADSKSILLDILAYRALGYSKIKLPLNTTEYWSKLNELEQSIDLSESILLDNSSRKLPFYNLNQYGYPIKLYASATTVFTQMLLEQYKCNVNNHVIEVKEGDVVIDAGGCYGDTALYFAHKAGAHGKVFSFEFMPDNIKIFQQNLALNPALASHIEIVPNPLWSSSAEKLYIQGQGSGAHITTTPVKPSALQVETTAIDDFVRGKSLHQVNFIKMDIEGAELAALKGAIHTITRFKPKLAICVYHHLNDFWEIPQWIDSLDLNYKFSLRHFTIHAEETVLFAEVV